MWQHQHQQRHHIIMHHVFLMHLLHRHQLSIPEKEVTLLPCMKAPLTQVEKDLLEEKEMVHLNNRVGDKGMGLAICVLH